MPILSDDWNQRMALLNRNRFLGQLEFGRQWAHPWKFNVTWNSTEQAWQVLWFRPGLVNGNEAVFHVAHAPPSPERRVDEPLKEDVRPSELIPFLIRAKQTRLHVGNAGVPPYFRHQFGLDPEETPAESVGPARSAEDLEAEANRKAATARAQQTESSSLVRIWSTQLILQARFPYLITNAEGRPAVTWRDGAESEASPPVIRQFIQQPDPVAPNPYRRLATIFWVQRVSESVSDLSESPEPATARPCIQYHCHWNLRHRFSYEIFDIESNPLGLRTGLAFGQADRVIEGVLDTDNFFNEQADQALGRLEIRSAFEMA